MAKVQFLVACLLSLCLSQVISKTSFGFDDETDENKGVGEFLKAAEELRKAELDGVAHEKLNDPAYKKVALSLSFIKENGGAAAFLQDPRNKDMPQALKTLLNGLVKIEKGQ